MNYYFIGIKGSGMSTLANLLFDLGNNIIGYDDCMEDKFTMTGLNQRGIEIYNKDNLPELPQNTIVTYTAAISESHPEITRLKNLGYLIIPYHELIGSLTKEFESICVCGTHGKTTTSLMISKILKDSIGCSYFVGDGSGHGEKNNKLLVIESCEYNRHFLSYYPFNTVLTNIELDHTETYHDIKMMIDTFQTFVDKTKNAIILCGDDLNTLELHSDKKMYYYGFNDNNNLRVMNKVVKDNRTCFDVYYNHLYYDSYSLPIFGDHLVRDSLAAIMVSILYDVDKQIVKKVLENYVPANRRFNETILLDNIIIDDYAHHPTEIKVTYNSCHEKYPDRKIIGIFLPNTYSRTEALFDEFVNSLKLFDKAYLMEIKCDRERQEDYPLVSSQKLVEKIPNSEMISIETISKLKDYKNVVICFMSCANISPVINKYKEMFK